MTSALGFERRDPVGDVVGCRRLLFGLPLLKQQDGRTAQHAHVFVDVARTVIDSMRPATSGTIGLSAVAMDRPMLASVLALWSRRVNSFSTSSRDSPG